VRIEPPGTLDGGDVLRVGRRVFVGASARTNREGRAQLRALVEPLGYAVEEVPVRGCLHLKSAATEVGPETLLLNPAWVDRAAFDGLSLIEIAPEEPFSANALRVGNAVIHAAAFPRTRERLGQHGIDVRVVDVSELAKAEGGVTCCALIIEAGHAGDINRARSDRPKD
jgi:dimethylargininase